MTTKTKRCTTCGDPFAPSRTDYTVRCPRCRAATRAGCKPERTAKPYRQDVVAVDASRCTVRNAVTGACGKPATHAFRASTGEIFAECAEHRI